MLRNKTVFIIGAGANSEFKFPLGSELANSIRDLMSRSPNLSTSTEIGNLLLQLRKKEKRVDQEFIDAANDIFRGISFSASIDDFLNQRQGNPLVVRLGKMAIVYSILTAEGASSLTHVISGVSSLADRPTRDTWLFKLARLLLKDVSPGSEASIFNNVQFITFNYDRSLELFLARAISDALNFELKKAMEIVGNAPILHAYGSIGPLPGFRGPNGVNFGELGWGLDYVELSNRIRTYTESSTDPKDIDFVEEAMNSCRAPSVLGMRLSQTEYGIAKANDGIGKGANHRHRQRHL